MSSEETGSPPKTVFMLDGVELDAHDYHMEFEKQDLLYGSVVTRTGYISAEHTIFFDLIPFHKVYDVKKIDANVELVHKDELPDG